MHAIALRKLFTYFLLNISISLCFVLITALASAGDKPNCRQMELQLVKSKCEIEDPTISIIAEVLK